MKISPSTSLLTAAALFAAVARGEDAEYLDCSSEYHRTGELDGGHLKLSYTVVLDEGADLNNTLTAPQGTMSVELIYYGLGYVSLGTASSTKGRMKGGEAIVGVPDTQDPSKSFILKYDMPSHHGIDEHESQTLMDASVVQDTEAGTTTLRYKKRLLEDGEHVIHGNGGLTTFLWAYGYDSRLVEHKDAGAFSVRLTPCIDGVTRADSDRTIQYVDVSNRNNYDMWVAHGVLAGLAWGLFAPLAILASIFRKHLPSPGLWMNLHKYLHLLVVVCTIISLVLAIVAIEDEGGLAEGHEGQFHALVGYIITGLVVLQSAAGLIRPAAPGQHSNAKADNEEGSSGEEHNATDNSEEHTKASKKAAADNGACEKTKLRFFWEIGHRLLGLGLLGLAWFQVDLGIHLADDRFGSTFNARIIWWVGIGIIGVLILGSGAQRSLKAGKQENEPATAGRADAAKEMSC